MYDQGGGTLPSSRSGLYTVTLQAISTIKGVETVVLELSDIGRWWVSNPSDAKEKLYRVGMSKDGTTVSVKARVASSVLNANPRIDSLDAKSGGTQFSVEPAVGRILLGVCVCSRGDRQQQRLRRSPACDLVPEDRQRQGDQRDLRRLCCLSS